MDKCQKVSDRDVCFTGKKIINILDNKYRDNEEKALDLIKHSKFADCVDDIVYHYY